MNPFPDIVPRALASIDKEKKKSKKERDARAKPVAANKNTGLLSFGDEMDDDEQVMSMISSVRQRDASSSLSEVDASGGRLQKQKGKSAHDVLDDEALSKSLAVRPEELGIYEVR